MTQTTLTGGGQGRVALVTGGARGIGEAVSLRLAGDGAAVAVLDLDLESCSRVAQQIEVAGGAAYPVRADVTFEDDVAAAVAQVVSKLGPPTILVNNAGLLRDNLLHEMSLDDWESVMGVHLRGAFLMIRAVQGFMREAGWGRIVNMSSTSALGNRGQTNYASAKAGLQGLSKTLAIELGRYGITVNAVAPGFIATPMTEQTAARLGISFEEFLERVGADNPMGRAGQPGDVAAAVSYFASKDAGYVSGQVLYVAGGPRD